MNNKLEVIGIDHGWSMMKTISQVFATGVMMIYTWMAIMIMIGMTGIVIMPMVWMTQWMNLKRIGKYGR